MHPTIAQALKPFTPPAQRDYLVTINDETHTVSSQSCAMAIIQAVRSQFDDKPLPDSLTISGRPVRKIARTE